MMTKWILCFAKENKTTTNNSTKLSNDTIFTRDLYEGGFSYAGEHLCPENGEPIKLLIIVCSKITNVENRTAIRQTWGHFGARRDISIVFLLGANQNSSLPSIVQKEKYIYDDMIFGNSIDSYDNLTLKSISMLEWVEKYCNKAEFIFKTDDDMFINVPLLMNFIDNHENASREIFGDLAEKWEPFRSPKSKYYISKEQYPEKYFPDFQPGPGYLITRDLISELFKESLAPNRFYFKLEDVYVTGFVAEAIGAKRINIEEFKEPKLLFFNICKVRNSIKFHEVRNLQYKLWQILMDPSINC